MYHIVVLVAAAQCSRHHRPSPLQLPARLRLSSPCSRLASPAQAPSRSASLVVACVLPLLVASVERECKKRD